MKTTFIENALAAQLAKISSQEPIRGLISGGPVGAHLDAVKIITNKFKGGLMSKMAETAIKHLPAGSKIVYLAAKGSKTPSAQEGIEALWHEGFWDYRKKLLEEAPKCQGFALGAAVANLIPKTPWEGKFPSHLYKEGEDINIPFILAPRLINEVKKANPALNLAGFKLLSGVPREELVSAAYKVLLESGSRMVFANDAREPEKKIQVTLERGEIEMGMDEASRQIALLFCDRHFKTKVGAKPMPEVPSQFEALLAQWKHRFRATPEGHLFGAVALRHEGGFFCTGRGKREAEEKAFVESIDWENNCVHALGMKASLNAPLLARVFAQNPAARIILHFHDNQDRFNLIPYAPSGTLRDSLRQVPQGAFAIEGHGCMIPLRSDGSAL